jgi:hypothetical protein
LVVVVFGFGRVVVVVLGRVVVVVLGCVVVVTESRNRATYARAVASEPREVFVDTRSRSSWLS